MSRKGIKYPCQECGYERASRDEFCPNCEPELIRIVDYRRDHTLEVPRYICPECGLEPNHPPRSDHRWCGRCGTEMKLWQGREPVAQCYGCNKIIDYGEEYCWHCWEAWRASTAGRRHFARRAQGSSWTYPESHSWEGQDFNIWDGGWLSDAAAETAPSSAQWQAMPPPTSLYSDAPAKKARSQPTWPQQQPRSWQPKSTGPDSSSGSQLAEAAPPPPAAPLAVPPAAPVAVPEAASTAAPAAAPGPLDSSGRQ